LFLLYYSYSKLTFEYLLTNNKQQEEICLN